MPSRGGAAVRVICALVTGATTVIAQPLPAGAGAAIVQARCITCHETDLITSQRLSPAGWIREVNKMRSWGAVVSEADRAVLEPYLATNFGDKPVAASLANDAVEGLFARACLTCHDADIIAGQRLTQAGWAREVEKMMRWGATVSQADKDLLVADLSVRFGPPFRAAR